MLFRGSLRRLPSVFRASSRPVTSTTASTYSQAGSGSGSGSSGSTRSRRLLWAALPVAVATGAALTVRSRRVAEAEHDPATVRSNLANASTSELVRGYFVWGMCGLPVIIDAAPGLLNALTHSPIPGLKALTETAVRYTFFNQFVAGEDLPETIDTVTHLYSKNVGSLLNYGAEAIIDSSKGNASDLLHEHNFKQDMAAVEALGEFERHLAETGGKTGSSQFAVKITGLIDYGVLERASTTLCRLRPVSVPTGQPLTATLEEVPFPGIPQASDAALIACDENSTVVVPAAGAIEPTGILATDQGVTDADMAELHLLWKRMHALSTKARDVGVKLLIDAEYAASQPAMDALTLLLSREFNRPEEGKPFNGPTIFGTYQSYLRRAPYLIDMAIADADQHGYALGVKLVRGAYFVSERKKWLKEGRSGDDPIWPDKVATDRAYDDSAIKLTAKLAEQLAGPNPELALSVVYATHNPESVKLVFDNLEETGLAVRQYSKKEQEEGTGVGAPLRLRPDVQGKIFVAQLYGMRDELTDSVAETLDSDGLPVALKYIAYGKLEEVLPYLARRAIENKALMAGDGGASVERKRVGDELWRRITGAPVSQA